MQSSRNDEIRKCTTGKACSGEKGKNVATKAIHDCMCGSRIYSTISAEARNRDGFDKERYTDACLI